MQPTEANISKLSQLVRANVTKEKSLGLRVDKCRARVVELEKYFKDAKAILGAAEELRTQHALTVAELSIQLTAVSAKDLPAIKVVETDPGIRGDTASGGTKPATVETGATVKVPLYLESGEIIKIDTRTRAYVERVR